MLAGFYCCVLLACYCAYHELGSHSGSSEEGYYECQLRATCADLMKEELAAYDLSRILRRLRELARRATIYCSLSARDVFGRVQSGIMLPRLGVEVWLDPRIDVFSKAFARELLDTHMKRCNENLAELRAAKELAKRIVAGLDAVLRERDVLVAEYESVQQVAFPAPLNGDAPGELGGHAPQTGTEKFQAAEIAAEQRELGRSMQEVKGLQVRIGEVIKHFEGAEALRSKFMEDMQKRLALHSQARALFMESVNPVIVLYSQLNDHQKLESQKSMSDWRRHSFVEAGWLLGSIDARIFSAEALSSEEKRLEMAQLKVLCDTLHSKSLDYELSSGVVKSVLDEFRGNPTTTFAFLKIVRFRMHWMRSKVMRENVESIVRLLSFCRNFDWSGFVPHSVEEANFVGQWHRVEGMVGEWLERLQRAWPGFHQACEIARYVDWTFKALMRRPEQLAEALRKKLQDLVFEAQQEVQSQEKK